MGNMSNLDAIGFANQFDSNFVEGENSSEATVVRTNETFVVTAQNVDFFYGKQQALKGVNLEIKQGQVTCLIGPSGCGKSTFLRTLNRMNDRIPGSVVKGTITIDGEDIYSKKVDLMNLRRKVGMVFQKPNPFPMSIYENVAMAPRLHYGIKNPDLEQVVEDSLKRAALWDEVKDDYKKKSALSLSGGQQQRLCIARTLAVQPEIILMDEPCSALDPISTYKVEELIQELAGDYTLIVVTHNMHQAARISRETAFFMMGELVEFGLTDDIFQRPRVRATDDYVSGRFG